VGTLSRVAQASPEGGAFRRFWRVLKQLFHEVTGAIFGVLALGWMNSAARAWTRDVAHWLIALAVGVAALFAFFSVTQFLRARRMR
jgi:galactitol-specific phosphotransferase system IIC component